MLIKFIFFTLVTLAFTNYVSLSYEIFQPTSAKAKRSSLPVPTVTPVVSPTPLPCPNRISIEGLSTDFKAGETITFVANISTSDNKPIYKWTISSGIIIAGQGTPVITVETTNEMAGQSITATVEIEGVNNECPNKSASATALIAVLPQAVVVESFSYKDTVDRKESLERLAIEIENDPSSRIAILAYSKKNESAIKTERRLIQDKLFLEKLGIAQDRIVAVNAGQSAEAKSEVYIIPAGAELPEVPTTDLTTITGLVRDQNGIPLPGTSVTAVKNGNNKTFTATTDPEGIYSMKPVETGKYNVTASKSGNRQTKQTSNISAQRTEVISFELP